MGPANEYWKLPKECVRLDQYDVDGRPTTSTCDFSDNRRDADTVWLVGDSHAQEWQGPLLDLARERHWVLKIAVLGGCPFARIAFTGYGADSTEEARDACTGWTDRMSRVIAMDAPSTVLVAFYARAERADDGSRRSQTAQYRDGLEVYWKRWTGAGAHVAVLGDPPLNGQVREVDCVALNPRNPKACAVDRDVAQPPDPLSRAARESRDPNVSLIDLTDYFCDERLCYAVVGKVAVYYDVNHMNLEFSRTLKPMIADALDRER